MKTAITNSMKHIKIIALFAILAGSVFSANAQKEDWGTDSLECKKCLSTTAWSVRNVFRCTMSL